MCIGRSHGIHAEPTTFGLKLAQAYAEFDRAKSRLIHAKNEISTCAISGAVGTFANVDPRVESYVASKLGLSIEPISSQIIPRDRHAMFFATLGVISGSLERLATEIRHLQRTEVREVEEYFEPGQPNSGWVHVSYVKEINSNRKEYLMAIKKNGKTEYKPILGLSTDRYVK